MSRLDSKETPCYPYFDTAMAAPSENMYELAYLANPDLDEAGLDALKIEVDGLVVRLGGSIREYVGGAKQRLGYSVKKKQNAFVVSEHVLLPDGHAFRKELRANGKILRFMMVSVSEKFLKRLRQPKIQMVQPLGRTSQASIEKAVKRQPAPTAAEKPAEERQADISEIEKKLDEILSREF